MITHSYLAWEWGVNTEYYGSVTTLLQGHTKTNSEERLSIKSRIHLHCRIMLSSFEIKHKLKVMEDYVRSSIGPSPGHATLHSEQCMKQVWKGELGRTKLLTK